MRHYDTSLVGHERHSRKYAFDERYDEMRLWVFYVLGWEFRYHCYGTREGLDCGRHVTHLTYGVVRRCMVAVLRARCSGTAYDGVI